jgi:hypothetical protein
MKTLIFDCDDHYEAEKLASLLSVQKDGTVWVSGIAAVIGKELVIQLKDRSSHAVILKTTGNADRLKNLLSDVLAGRAVIRSSESSGMKATIAVD